MSTSVQALLVVLALALLLGSAIEFFGNKHHRYWYGQGNRRWCRRCSQCQIKAACECHPDQLRWKVFGRQVYDPNCICHRDTQ